MQAKLIRLIYGKNVHTVDISIVYSAISTIPEGVKYTFALIYRSHIFPIYDPDLLFSNKKSENFQNSVSVFGFWSAEFRSASRLDYGTFLSVVDLLVGFLYFHYGIIQVSIITLK